MQEKGSGDYRDEFGRSNVQLLRSFSFVCEVDAPPDPEVHQVSMNVLDPVTAITSDGPDDPGEDDVPER